MRSAPDRFHHRRPWRLKRKIPLNVRGQFFAVVVDDSSDYSGNGFTHRTEFYIHTRVIGDADGAGFGLPPVIMKR